jgi:hypothetical protein
MDKLLPFCVNCGRSAAASAQYCDQCGTRRKAQPINCGVWSGKSVSDIRKVLKNLCPSQEFTFGCLAIVMLYIGTAMSTPDQPSRTDASALADGCQDLRREWKTPLTQDEVDLLNTCDQMARAGNNLQGELGNK